jgi:hypothetical protein
MTSEVVPYDNVKMIVKYVKKNGRVPVGAVGAVKFGNSPDVFITGSLCKTSVEKFDKNRAKDLIVARAHEMLVNKRNAPVANSLGAEIVIMAERASRYFKDCEKFIVSGIKA